MGTEITDNNYFGCVITLLNPGANIGYHLYDVKHIKTGEVIHAINKNQSYRIARLLHFEFSAFLTVMREKHILELRKET